MSLPAPAPIYYGRRAMVYLSDLWNRREFVWFLAVSNFQARNASTAFGLFWWILNPLLLSLVYYFVFGFIFPGGRDIVYLMAGMFPFHYTAQSMTGGANSIINNGKLLANLRFPRIILPAASVLESSLGFIVSLALVVAIAAITQGVIPGFGLLLLLIIIPLQGLFNLGLGAMAARLAVPFRDINNIIPYINRIWLYTSPIIWHASRIEDSSREALALLAKLNPMFPIISVYRSALLGYPFDPAMLTQSAIWAVVVCLIGVGLFIKYEGKIVRHL